MLAMAAAQRWASDTAQPVITPLSIHTKETIRVTGRRFSGFPGGNGPGAGILCIGRVPAFGNGGFLLMFTLCA